jgi:hypothetical protein
MNKLYLFWVTVLLALFLVLYKNTREYPNGYTIIPNFIPKNDVQEVIRDWDNKDYSSVKEYFLNPGKNIQIRNNINRLLGSDYELIDYVYFIENSAIHTYHRDLTSSKSHNNLQHPSYTMILYLDESDTGLNVVPGSHIDACGIYLIDKSKKLSFKAGTALIFDADLLHAGTASETVKRRVIQFKIIHKDDIVKMPHLQQFHVLIDKQNNKPLYIKHVETALTRHFPFAQDLFKETIKTSFDEEKTPTQELISSLIFSNKDFYKPIRI